MTDHECIDAEINEMLETMMQGGIPEIVAAEKENHFLARHAYNDLEERILTAAIAFVNGRASAKSTTPEPMLIDVLGEMFCPRCLMLWAQYVGGCCFPHTLSERLTTRDGSLSLVDASEQPCFSTPEGNQLN